MRYFDTSYLARCYTEDAGWEAVRALAGEEPVACSSLGRVETAAALHRKLREGSLAPEDHAEVALQFCDDCEAGLWRWLPMGDALAAAAAEKLRTLPASIFIRGADALHLLCAAENGFTEVFSHDRHFLAAAPHFGVAGRDVI